jgi:hypothetical protein
VVHGGVGWGSNAGERGRPWALDAYVPLEAVDGLQQQLAELASDDAGADERVLLRTVSGTWPFPKHHQLAAQPLAAFDLLDYPDQVARRIGRGVLV